MTLKRGINMKILIVLAIIFQIHILSAQEIDKNADYNTGLEYYNAKDFKGSYDIFSKIYLTKLADIKFNFYFGRSAYETGHYEIALAAFERVEMLDSGNLRNKLELARTYFMLKMYEDSTNSYKEVLANPNIPENVRINIELALSRASKVQQKSFTYARITANYIYDSNINYASIGGYDTETFGHLPGRDRISDTALELAANITNIYDIGEKSGFAIKNSFSFSQKDYNSYNDYDLQYFSYNPSLIYQETLYTVELVFGLETVQLARKKWETDFSFMPKLQYNHSTTLSSTIYFKYKKSNYKDSKEYLDAKRYEYSYGLQDILSPRSYVQGNVYYIKQDSVRGTDTLVNYKEYKTNVIYVNQLTSTYGIDLFGQMKSRKYADKSVIFGNQRSDVGFLGSAGLSVKLMPTLTFKLKTSYEHVDSNQDAFTWQKFTASAGLIKTF